MAPNSISECCIVDCVSIIEMHIRVDCGLAEDTSVIEMPTDNGIVKGTYIVKIHTD